MKAREVHPASVAGKENRKTNSRVRRYETSTVDDGDHRWRVRVGNRWNVQSFQWGQKLGKGRFGSVYAAKEKESGFICALKVTPPSRARFRIANSTTCINLRSERRSCTGANSRNLKWNIKFAEKLKFRSESNTIDCRAPVPLHASVGVHLPLCYCPCRAT